MAKMNPVYVFDKDCDDFTTTGLAGDLRPIEAVYTEEKNGISEIEMRLTYDQYAKWKHCQVGNFIKCEIPVRVPPAIMNDQYADTVKVAE